MINWESVRAIKAGRRPGCAVVARGAVITKQPQMVIWFGVACRTLLGCASENPILMAVSTGYGAVRPGKREGCQGVVECGIFPAFRRVALGAVLSELPGMGIVLSMAGGAILGCPFIDSIFMAICTSHPRMHPDEGKGS